MASWVEGEEKGASREGWQGGRSPLYYQGGPHGRRGLVGKPHWKGVTQGSPEMAGPACLPKQRECVFLPQ